MSLNWNIAKCTEHEELTKPGEAWDITNALIWGTMATGMRAITPQNYDEFFSRVVAMQQQNGAWLQYNGTPRPVTLADVQRRIGLRTNANTITPKQFEAQLGRMAMEAACRETVSQRNNLKEGVASLQRLTSPQ